MKKYTPEEELENVDDIDCEALMNSVPEYDEVEGELTEKDIDNMIVGYKSQGLYY